MPARYRDLRPIGGVNGIVYRARDEVRGVDVAVKVLRRGSAQDRLRFEREVAALQRTSDRGVVPLLDHGVADDHPWFAMPWVDGSPFPGAPLPVSWTALEPVARALLETLARLHDAGIVHRDLKPANVLVDGDGRPVLLDFGLARGDALGATMTGTGAVVGTPRYMAPEQARGGRSDHRADLHAAGLMLFEALTGDVPHAASAVWRVLEARAHRVAPSIAALVPGLPAHVADTLDRLLALEPADRPASARAVLRGLRGDTTPSDRLPRLGPREPLDALLTAAREGRRCTLSGARGAGKTRALADVAATLEAEGRTCLRAMPGARPFESLRALVGEPDAPGADAIERAMAERVAERLRDAVLLVDDLDAVDAWSRQLLATIEGPVLATRTDAGDVALAPLADVHLRALFHGPERLFHLVGDAAALLHRRTAGVPARVAAEIEHWVAVGLARWDGDRLRTDRASLERVAAGLVGAPTSDRADARLEDTLDELLAWIHLGKPATTANVLAAARGEPVWQIELQLASLERAGAVVRGADGWEPTRPAASLLAWDSVERRSAHDALARALPAGAPGRLFHLLVTGRVAEMVAEATLQAREAWREGRLARATELLAEALPVALEAGDLPGQRQLLEALLDVALEDASLGALARALDLAGRAPGAPGYAIALLQAAREAQEGEHAGARARLEALGPLDDAHREVHRRGQLVALASGVGGQVHADAVSEAYAWARATGIPTIEATARGWRAQLAYMGLRLAEAAEEAEAAAEGVATVGQRVDLLFRAAVARLEAGDVAGTQAVTEALLREARARRLPRSEVRAEWVLRSLANRLGATEVDEELLAAVAALGAPGIAANVEVVEAACAWRGGDHARGRALAVLASTHFQEAGNVGGDIFAEALAVACGRGGRVYAEAVAERAVETGRPDLVVEVLGLLAPQLDRARWRPAVMAALDGMAARPSEWVGGAVSPNWVKEAFGAPQE